MGADYEGVLAFREVRNPPPLQFRYTNHDGVTEDRAILSPEVAFGESKYHPGVPPSWYLMGLDLRRTGMSRVFLLDQLLPPPQHDYGLMAAGTPRSGRWTATRKKFLEENPACVACGVRKLLNVHHVTPFHIKPEWELEFANLVTLCETPSHNCHFMFGHLLDWRAYNPNVREDSARMLKSVIGRVYD